MGQLLSSKVVNVERPPSIRAFPVISTAVAGAIGVTERGPLTPTRTTSFDEWVGLYGGFIAASTMAAQVQAFFAQQDGGGDLVFKRIVHLNSILDEATKTSAAATKTLSTPAVAATAGTILGTVQAPFLLSPADTIVIKVDGGGALTATFNATAGARTSGNVQPFALVNGDTLTLKVDGGPVQTVTFLTAEFVSIAAATAAEVAAVINAKTFGLTATVVAGAVVLTSDRKGTSSSIEVTGGTANAVGKLNFPTPVSSGTGNVAFIDAVTAAEVETVVEAAVAGISVTNESNKVRITSNTTGVASSVEVTTTSTADQIMGFDNLVHSGTAAGTYTTLRVDGKYDGAYANSLRAKIDAPTSGVAGEFNFSIIRANVAVEVFPNVSMDDAAANYIEAVVNGDDGSVLVTVTDLDAATTAVLQIPAAGNFALAGGDDGLTSLNDADYAGSQAGATGLYALDAFEDVIRTVIVPDRATPAVQNALVDYCDITHEREKFAVVTAPADLDRDEIVAWVKNTANLKGKAEVAAVYWPEVQILNPSRSAFGDTELLTVPNSMLVAGLYARVDGARDGGVYDEPAGLERGILAGVLGVADETVNEERTRDIIVPEHINPIRTRPGSPFFIDDELVLKRDSNFPTVAQRRGATFIEISVKEGLETFRHRANDDQTRNEVKDSIEAFLLIQFKNRAFRGETPEDSYFVDVSTKLNTPVVIAAEKLLTKIGIATQRPARFIVNEFSQDLRDVAAEV